MKQLLFSIVFFCACLFTIHAQDETDYTDDEIISIYSIGELHNQALEAGFERLQSIYGARYTGGRSGEDLFDLHKTFEKHTAEYITKALAVIDIDLQPYIDNVNVMFATKDYLEQDIVSSVKASKEGETLSAELLNALAEIDHIMDDELRCFDKNEYDNLVRKYIPILKTHKEKGYLVACGSIAYYSRKYWAQNLEKWERFFTMEQSTAIIINTSNDIMTFGENQGIMRETEYVYPLPLVYTYYQTNYKADPGKDISKADVKGAIVGGISGAIGGALGGTITLGPFGTIGGAVGMGIVGAATGATKSSLSAALDKLWNYMSRS